MTSVTKTLILLTESAGYRLSDFEVRSSPDSVREVMESNGCTVGARAAVFPVAGLQPAYEIYDASDRERIDRLKEEILSDDGYIAKLVIRPDGEVVEGQHRAWALKELNFDNAPVAIVYAPEDVIPDPKALVAALPKMRSDHLNQLVSQLLQIVFAKENLDDYDPPRGWEEAWNAGTTEIKRQLAK